MAESILKQLQGMSKLWKDVKPRKSGQFQDLPPGDYRGICKTARLENSKGTGRLQIAWQHRITSGPEKNRMCNTYQGIVDNDSISWVKGAIAAHEVDPPKNIENLPKYLNKCLGKEINITVVQNGTFTNKYFNPLGKSKEDLEEEEDLDLEDM